MKQNMGTLDRIIRAIVAVVIGILCFTGVINGVFAIVLGIIAIILLITSIIGFCPLYLPFRFSSKKN